MAEMHIGISPRAIGANNDDLIDGPVYTQS